MTPMKKPASLARKPSPTSLVCSEHGIQQVKDLSVCPICGETPVAS